jgi:hypothetical protein
MLEELADDLERVDLDTIDGEFYWRCCRVDLIDQVERICASPLREKRHVERDDRRYEEAEDAFGFLRQGLRRAKLVRDMATNAADLYPRAVWRRLLEGERVAMRAAEVTKHQDDLTASGLMLRLRVTSGAWTGADVEAELRRQASTVIGSLLNSDEHMLADDVGVSVRFSLIASTPEKSTNATPSVEVSVPYPLPPKDAIAREYDALVRGEMAWHLRLPGGGTRQEKETALRTWAVGLLMAAGAPFGSAMDLASQRASLAEVSQTRFGQDRQRLLERVPEALDFIYARAPMSRALANPGNGSAPLQPDEVDLSA